MPPPPMTNGICTDTPRYHSQADGFFRSATHVSYARGGCWFCISTMALLTNHCKATNTIIIDIYLQVQVQLSLLIHRPLCKLTENKLGTHSLHLLITRVRQMFSADSNPMLRVANSISLRLKVSLVNKQRACVEELTKLHTSIVLGTHESGTAGPSLINAPVASLVESPPCKSTLHVRPGL